MGVSACSRATRKSSRLILLLSRRCSCNQDVFKVDNFYFLSRFVFFSISGTMSSMTLYAKGYIKGIEQKGRDTYFVGNGD